MFKKILKSVITALLLCAGASQAQMSFSGQSFARQGIYPGSDRGKIILADINGDGRKDIISANTGNPSFYVITSSGIGTFTSTFKSYSTGVNNTYLPSSLAVADVNKDGALDIITTNKANRILKVFLNTQGGSNFIDNGSFGNGDNGAYDVAAGDINKDGNPDLAYVTQVNATVGNLVVLTGTGDGFFNSFRTYSVTSQAFCVGVADLNKDGFDDVVVTDKNFNYLVFTSTGASGILGNYKSYPANGASSVFKMKDINGDGNLDLINAYFNGISVATGNGDGTFTDRGGYGGVGVKEVDAADVDMDGKLDLIARYGTGIAVYKGNGDGTFNNVNISTDFFSVTFDDGNGGNIDVSDLDSDGKTDVVVTHTLAVANYMTVWKNITKSPQTITGFSIPSTTVYGSTITGLNAVATSGLVVTYSSSSTIAGIVGNSISTRGAGVVTITASQIGNSSFAAATPVTAVLTITKANLTITSNNFSQTYGDSPTFSGTLLGIVNNDVLTQVFNNSTSLFPVDVYTSGITTNANGTNIGNYNKIFNQGTLTVVAANLTVTGRPLTKTYGAANPAFTSTSVGFKNSDNLNGGVIISYGTISANADAGVYEYAVSLSGSKLSNYIVTTVAGTLTINKANLSVIGNNFTKVYGTNNPTFTTNNTGITNGDVLSVRIAPLASNTGVGIYNLPFDVSVSGSGLVNYNLTTVAGVLTITKANLTVTAQSFSRLINRANPVFTTSTTGLVAGEVLDISVLTTVTINSPQGVYALRPSVTGTTLSNYNLTTVAGTITVLCTVPSIVGTINSANDCVGNSYTFTANGRGTDIAYTWKNSMNEVVSSANTFTTTAAGIYTVSLAGACGSFVYNSSVIKLDTIPTPKFLVQPVSKNYCPSTAANLAVSVAGISYGQLRWSNGANSTSISVSTPGNYNVTFVGLCGTVISNNATVNSLLGTSIVATPANKSVCEGSSVGLEITALGDNLSYKWSDGSTNPMNNSTASGFYMATVTGTCGSKVSEEITISLIRALRISGISENATICGNQLPHRIFVDAFGDALSYTWNTGETNFQTNATTSGDYFVTVTGTCGTYISSAIGINVVDVTRIVTQPVSVTACEGSLATFTVSAVGGNLSYSWNNQMNTNASSYTTTVAGFTNQVSVMVSGTCGVENSSLANLVSKAKTVIEVAPESQVLNFENELRDLRVFARGSDPLTYAWSSGETTSTIMQKGVGTYTVTVTGACGTDTRTIILSLPTSPAVVSFVYTPTSLTSILSNIIVTINGNNFSNGATVTLGGVALTNIVVSSTVITGTIPAGSTIINPNNPSIVVQNFGAPVATPSQPQVIVFTDPSIPVSATVSGISASANLDNTTNPISVSIVGTGFQNGATITVGGVVLTNVIVVGNVITGTIPAGSTIINPSNPAIIVQNVGAAVAVPVVIPVVITTSTNQLIYQSTSFSIYPNPTNGEFSVLSLLPTTNSELLTIFNAQGIVVYSQKIVSEITQINANLAKGIYLVKVGNMSKKLVVE